MRTEQEIRELLDKCAKVRSWGVSNGPCPTEDDARDVSDDGADVQDAESNGGDDGRVDEEVALSR